MNKSLFVLLIFLVGCGPGEIPDPSRDRHVFNVKGYPVYYSKFNLDNHSYIMFDIGIYRSGSITVIHDPDCHCRGKDED